MFTKKIYNKIKIPKSLKTKLKKHAVAGGWNSGAAEVKKFKAIAKLQLMENQQNKCAYCELPLLSSEIDHIAPKGGDKHPKHVEYTFLPVNLVLSCHDCNSTFGKGQTDVIKRLGKHYTDSDFSIVHPYLDDPEEFFIIPSCKDGTPGAIPFVKPNTDKVHKEKARRYIEMFHLNTEAKMNELAKQRVAEKYSDEVHEFITAITSYKSHL
ncbi:retron system putative HNH endonuclease [Caproicibacterium amylolyticum]|uniref:TIGR02646 family protein n=1 Tax=Caproicibacterium amylolyticum TaxID=2766537 RepID=A0A7G9WGN7_9FIRM|nr:retron system putative HNH endonuclease [Caproicibacterium amylolyticum]QNO17849.1 TIGR02646 family protein [Caproicibacterium amylolyticum]